MWNKNSSNIDNPNNSTNIDKSNNTGFDYVKVLKGIAAGITTFTFVLGATFISDKVNRALHLIGKK